MRATFALIAVISALGLLPLCASAQSQTRPPFDAKKWVKEHDKNGDGAIDREEFQQAVTEAFYFRDKDKSGYLEITELKEASPAALAAVQRKENGRISLREYVNALFKDFDAADANHDGVLTVEEIEVYVRTNR
jgi:Ca2+-binding EF-hand superfamily protein